MNRFLLLATLAALVSPSQLTPNRPATIAWQPASAPFGGDADSLVFHGDHLLVKADGYGRSVWWLSPDGGTSWRLLSDRLGDAWSMTSLGRDLFVRDFDGLHRTADLGRSWRSCGAPQGRIATSATLVATREALIYWHPDVGLFRSNDRCATWNPVRVPWKIDGLPIGIVVAPDAGVVLVQLLHDWAWFRSTDDGQSWEGVAGPAAQPLPTASDGRPAIVFGTDLVIGTTKGVFRSIDAGRSWAPLGFGRRWTRSAVTSDGVLYATLDAGDARSMRTTLMRSGDGGKTWLAADGALRGQYIKDLVRDRSGAVYAAGESGVYRLEKSGQWRHLGLPVFFPTFLFAAPWGDVYLGTDYKGAYRSSDGGASWRPLWLPHRHPASITATARGDLLLASSDGVLRSRDRGDTWEMVDLQADVRALFTVPSTGTILAATPDRIFRSSDEGRTWVEDPPGSGDLFPESFAEGPNGVVFVGTGDGDVYELPSAQEPWRPLPSMSDGSPVAGLAVLANGDVLAGTSFGVFRWSRRSDAWEDLPLSREERPRVSSLLPVGSGHLVTATSAAGVFISNDDGRTWMPANRGLATRRVRRMAVGPDGEIYVATGTNGLEYGDDVTGGRLRIFTGRMARK